MNLAISEFTDKISTKGAVQPKSSGGMSQYMLCDERRMVSLIPLEAIEYIRTYADPQSKEACFSVLNKVGIDSICHVVAEGALLPQVSKTFQVPYLILYEWINSNQEYISKFEAAKKAAADVYAYLALETLNACHPTPADVALAKQVAAMYTWYAKTYAPETYTTDTQKAAGGAGDTFSMTLNYG